MDVTGDIRCIGVNDRRTDLFEGQYAVPNGISYNSYLILDERIAVLDTVDEGFGAEWLNRLQAELAGRKPDYLVIHHMEPDHSASLVRFLEQYPETTVVANAKTFAMMQQFFGEDFRCRSEIVKEGDVLTLGRRSLTFLMAPMVHWPEVMVSYEAADGILFSADAFGKFGVPDEADDWVTEARRYYIGIVGKYGAQVQALLKKAAKLDIRMICPLHGPVLKEKIETYIGLYDTWSSYRPESEGVCVAYASVYGHTKEAALLLAEQLREHGCTDVTVYDLARCDLAAAVADAFRCRRLVLASVTYNADVFPYMKEFLNHLTERNFRGRTIGLIENGSWAPMAAARMKEMLEKSKELQYPVEPVTIRSALTSANRAQLAQLAETLLKTAE